MSAVKNLNNEAPRSPRTRIGGYALLARMIDKGRAHIHGTPGEYHFGCPLDMMLLDFKGLSSDEAMSVLKSGASDDEMAKWLDDNGKAANQVKVKDWSDKVETYMPHDDPEKREWFIGECRPLGLDPKRTTLFDYLEADDRASFGGKAHEA